ncbi:hypothetical protein CTAM01_15271 [Colletotrichum tamarilloi]|uniref:Uncharacterized protein n=1 Tax=Colletotrichum tamarilloi TaxID=1209934 RepID=A0ABQ9QLV4_9PEZI|nr:uncharacterized protein CTAM01_15271 [Colletotrichum tamarilloi]KAK1477001.1 hypothetical protein CTAM01_15271 [Colletotrichum tamarilloi]
MRTGARHLSFKSETIKSLDARNVKPQLTLDSRRQIGLALYFLYQKAKNMGVIRARMIKELGRLQFQLLIRLMRIGASLLRFYRMNSALLFSTRSETKANRIPYMWTWSHTRIRTSLTMMPCHTHGAMTMATPNDVIQFTLVITGTSSFKPKTVATCSDICDHLEA